MKRILFTVLLLFGMAAYADAGSCAGLGRGIGLGRNRVVVGSRFNRGATLVVPTTTTTFSTAFSTAFVAQRVFVAAFQPVEIVTNSYGAAYTGGATPTPLTGPNDTEKILSAISASEQRLGARLDAHEARLNKLESKPMPPAKE